MYEKYPDKTNLNVVECNKIEWIMYIDPCNCTSLLLTKIRNIIIPGTVQEAGAPRTLDPESSQTASFNFKLVNKAFINRFNP